MEQVGYGLFDVTSLGEKTNNIKDKETILEVCWLRNRQIITKNRLNCRYQNTGNY